MTIANEIHNWMVHKAWKRAKKQHGSVQKSGVVQEMSSVVQ